MIRPAALLALFAAALGAGAEASSPAAPGSAPPSVTARADGFLVHSPSGLRLPREIPGPDATYAAALTAIDADKVEAVYGPVTLTIGAPTAAADAVMTPQGWKPDPDAPALPTLLFWGEGATPVTVSFLHSEDAPAQDWVSFAIQSQGWQVQLSSLYAPENRETVLRAAEAIWANFASANEKAP